MNRLKIIIFIVLATIVGSSYGATNTPNETPRAVQPQKVLFRNFGNTCFFDATLQCLLNIKPFTDILKKIDETTISITDPLSSKEKNKNIENALKALVRIIKRPTQRDQRKLYHAIMNYSEMRKYRQQDAAELLRYLFMFLDNKDFENHEEISKLFYFKSLSTIKCPTLQEIPSELEEDIQESNEPSYLKRKRFYSDHYSEVLDPTEYLQMPIPSDDGNVHPLPHCCSHFTKEETFDDNNKWFCNSCGKEVKAKKQIFMHTAPKILIIQLKRFDNMRRKKYTRISIPANRALTIQELFPEENTVVTQAENKDIQARYRLIGAIMHAGSFSGGHYTSYSFEPNGKKWFLYNDEGNKLYTSSNIERSITRKLTDPYILFYQRIDTEEDESDLKNHYFTNGPLIPKPEEPSKYEKFKKWMQKKKQLRARRRQKILQRINEENQETDKEIIEEACASLLKVNKLVIDIGRNGIGPVIASRILLPRLYDFIEDKINARYSEADDFYFLN